MKNKQLISAIVLAALFAIGGAVLYRNSRDEAKIRRQIAGICAQTEKTRGESPAAGAFKAAGLDKFLASKIVFSSDEPKFQREFTLQELKPLFIQYRNSCDTLSLDLEILGLAVSGSRASAQCNLSAAGFGRGEAEKFTGLRTAAVELEKIEGKWKIVRCTLSAPLDNR